MQKAAMVSLLLLIAVSVSFAQFGIKGGVNIGTFGGDDKAMYSIDPVNRTGLAGGISYKIGLIAGFSIQPEVMYSQKGAVYESGPAKMTNKFDYIDIPVLVQFSLPIPLVSPYIEGGAAYSILLSAKQKYEYSGNSSETDIKEHVTKNDLSLLVGVGVEVLILDINARYVLGQTKLVKDSDQKIYNRSIVLTAGIRF